ncbi:PulJ/GspJ family protein [Campylobacter sp. MIT 97-5078]|uniref:PulJ/GspJ family protein n=1 Tax=Campylobacter sp. MIT 97-5078 TaxID=1548153 RepID=UPI000512C500|nr:hypothetical protein [Campylobacter sp. MIT 97-5078]KGI56487.1 hypothetical protein LR59_07200 [Campylobacter sp. MIT 97-5078]TQR27993.1 hypothetical protein DMB91_01810 [Campylobacter sp. MIT 97-5078]
MTRAFSLLESVFALLVLALIFSFAYFALNQILKNQNISLQSLYEAQKELKNAPLKPLRLKPDELLELEFKEKTSSNSTFKLKSLKPAHRHYEAEFKDEKSF